MNNTNPVYTEKTECRDCYRCVRECPVKAIRIESGRAAIMIERCLSCGTCVSACPVKAKRIRSDVEKVKSAISGGASPIVSLAPSFVSEFPEWDQSSLIYALKRLGFRGVSETATGAEIVSASVSDIFSKSDDKILISSACPVVVELVHKYYPSLSGMVMNMCSPLLAHCRLLKKQFGTSTDIVFIGPCSAKKREADMNPDLLMASLTFSNLRVWLDAEGINPSLDFPRAKMENSHFITRTASRGRLYPVDGGMISGIVESCGSCDAKLMSISGMDAVMMALHDLDSGKIEGPLFLELLACAGGCVNGPAGSNRTSTVLKRASVIQSAGKNGGTEDVMELVDTEMDRHVPALTPVKFEERLIMEVLSSIGKYSARDELNCGGCGYGDCRSFAAAMLDGRAEKDMCVSYMRQLALKKANALIKTMPSGVVIVDDKLQILESNQRFASTIGGFAIEAYESREGLEGISIERIAPILTKFFVYVLRTGEDIPWKIVKTTESTIRLSVFSIEKCRVAGAIIHNAAEPAIRSEELVIQARDLIRKNLATTQKIAYLLGENASETQSALSSIISMYSNIDERSSEEAQK